MSDKEVELCQEAIVVIGEASESEDDDHSDVYKSDLSLDSNVNVFYTSSSQPKSSNSIRSHKADCSPEKLTLKEDHFNSALPENNLITERLIKDNHQLHNSINNFSTQQYQKTLNELNELNQNLIKSHEQIQSVSQYLEKTKYNLSSLDDNLSEIFQRFNDCKLRI